MGTAAPTRRTDRIIAVVVLVFAIAVFAYSATFPKAVQPADPGIGTWPQTISVLIAAMAVLVLAMPQPTEPLPRGIGLIRVGAAMVLLLAYALVIDELGFTFSTILFLVALLLLSGVRSWIALVVVPLIGGAGLFYLFRYVLEVPLPRSGFGGLPV